LRNLGKNLEARFYGIFLVIHSRKENKNYKKKGRKKEKKREEKKGKKEGKKKKKKGCIGYIKTQNKTTKLEHGGCGV